MIDKIQKFTSFLIVLVIVSALVAFASYDYKVSNNLILMTDSSFLNNKSLEIIDKINKKTEWENTKSTTSKVKK